MRPARRRVAGIDDRTCDCAQGCPPTLTNRPNPAALAHLAPGDDELPPDLARLGQVVATVALRQIYANCPKYIQQREAERTSVPPGQPRWSHSLTPAQRQLVESADTFFVATADRDTDSPYAPAHADVSHRGGDPGFVECLTGTRLRWPDYPGNSMFGTLGNIAVNPSVGLLFLDWSTGTTLQLTGHAAIDWHDDGQLPGAERSVVLDLTACVEIPQHSPLRWTAPTYSRHNPPVRLIDDA